MARQNRRQQISRFLSRLFGNSAATSAGRTRRKRTVSRHRQVTEQLEDRALLTLVGVDFGGGTSPTNWTAFSGTADTTLSNLNDEFGSGTAIDLAVAFDTNPGGNVSFAPPANELPIHATSLSGLDESYTDQGNVELTFQELIPGQSYELFVFAGDSFASNQLVTISSPATSTIITSFAQPHGVNQLLVNDQVGDSSTPLQSYAVMAPADANGEILIRIDTSNDPAGFLGLAGVAIQKRSPPVGLVLNEIVADLPGGTDNPNEYVELRGAAGQSLDDVFLVFVEGNAQPEQGEIRAGASGVIDLSGSTLGANGYLAIVDDATDPYTIDTGASVLNVSGLDIGDAPYTSFLVYVDPVSGTVPAAGQDLDAGNDGLDGLPVGWTLLDGISVLDGAVGSRGYAQIAFSPTADGLLEPGAALVTTGFGAQTNHVMRAGVNMPADAPLIYDGFDYTPDGTDLDGQNGGNGFAGAWQAGGFNADAANTEFYDVLQGTLESGGLDAEGGRVSVPSLGSIGGIRRQLSSAIGADGTTSYFSVLMEPQGTLGGGAFGGFFGMYLDSVSGNDLFVGGSGSGFYGIENRGGANSVASTTAPVVGETALLVIKAEFLAGDDRFTLYVNPTPGGLEPAAGFVKQDLDLGLVDALTIYSTGEFELDEVRIGDTFESVTPPAVGVAADWVAFELAGTPPDLTVAQSTNPAYLPGSFITNHVGAVNPSFASPPPTALIVTIADASMSENGGTTTATVTRNTDTTNPLNVTLMSDDTSEATVIGSVIIDAGQTVSPEFDINAVDDAFADGTQTVTITASAPAHLDGTDVVDILDDEVAELIVTISAQQIGEAAGAAATTATVSRSTDTTQALTVTLMSDDTTEATVVGTVDIAAGASTSAPFDIDAVDDGLVDGTQTVTISATATVTISGSNVVIQGSDTVNVLDNDLGSWIQQGPAPTQNAQLEPNTQPNQQVTGAIHTVLAHPTDPDILYIGAVNGGIWKTTDATSVNPTWVPQTDFLTALSIGAMAFDPTDASSNTIVAGTAAYSSYNGFGGRRGFVYRTTDGGNTWTELAAAGLGPQNISGIAVRGNQIVITSTAGNGGIFRSTDGGATFTGINSADFTIGDNFSDLVVDPSAPTGQRLYAANQGTGGPGGIYRSDDFGLTWTKITGPVINPAMQNLLTASNNIEMAIHPTTGRLFVAVLVNSQPHGVFFSSNPAASTPTWNQMDVPVLPLGASNPITDASNASPIVITSANHGLFTGDFVVIDGVTGNTAANGFYRVTVTGANTFSLNTSAGSGAYVSGGTWTRVTGPSPTAKDVDEITGAQGRIHFSIVVDPTNQNIVYIGGDRQDRPSAIGDSTFGGAIFRGDAGIPRNPNVVPSPQWDHITHDIVPSLDPTGGTANGTSTHADSREMTFDANGDLIETDDGGIFRRTSPRDNTGDWFSLAGSLAVIEFHDIAYDSLSDVLMGGTQDNGTHFQVTPDDQVWDFLSGGDGGDVSVDAVTLAGSNQSIRYSSSQNLGGFRRTVWDQNNNLISTSFPNLAVTGGSATFSPQFKTPVELNAVDPQRMIIQGGNAIYESTDQGDNITQVGGNSFPGFLQDAVAYGGYQNGVPNLEVFYVGVGQQIRVRTSVGGAVLTIDPEPASFDDIRDVTMNSRDWSNAFAIDSDQVYQSTNAGVNWNDITGNLLSLGGDLRTMVYLATAAADALVVGTNSGVYASFTTSLGTWFQLGTGLPNVSVFDMVYNAADDVLVGGTLGRGAWTLPQASQVLPTTPDVFVGDVTVTEGTSAAAFTVSLATPAVNVVTLQLTTNDDSAVGGQDFAPTTGTVTIPIGATTATGTFNVPIVNDFIPELVETFTVSVTGVLTGTVGSTADTGTGTIIDNDATVRVQIAAAAISESDGAAATTATVTRNTPNGAPLDVMLMSDDTSEATVVGIVSIPGGQNSVTFDIDAVQDFFVDGTQTVTITPSAVGHIPFSDTVDVLDVDVPTLFVSIAADSISETDGPAATTATVRRNTDPATPLTVGLMSSDTAEATVMSSVTIGAGQMSSAPFDINAIDELIIDGTKVVTITASAFGFVDGTDTVDVTDNETPLITLSVDKPNAPEVNGEVVTVTATLSFASTAPVTIILAVGGTATGGGTDYDDPVTTQIDIPAGQLSGSINFTIVGDTLDEVDETVVFTVQSATNAEEGTPQQAVVNIIDNDPPPTVIVTVPANVNEGDTATFNVALSALSGKAVTLTLALGGAAVGGGVDYNDPSPLQITIPAGTLSVDVDVTTLADGLDEANESLILGATGFVNATAGANSQATTLVIDQDPPPTVRMFVDTPTVAEDFGRATFTATLSTVSGQDVTVDLTTAGAATAGLDYVLSANQIVIPAGRISSSLVLTALRDDLDEFNEDAILQISSATNATVVGTPSATTTIIDNDIAPTVTLSASAPSVLESDGTVTFFATLNAVSGKPVTVNLNLRGDATSGLDYTASPLSFVIPAGSLSGSVVLTLIPDGIDEFDEVAVVEFVSVVNAVENIVQESSTLIRDIDPPPTVSLVLPQDTIAEATGESTTLNVVLSGPSGKDVTVNLGITGMATGGGVDYTGGSAQVLIPAGQTSVPVTFTAVNDALDEFDETIVVDILSAANATQAGAQQQTITITDDDPLPTVGLSVDQTTINEIGGVAIVTATLSEVSGRDVLVSLTLGGLATTGTDYSIAQNSILIPAGSLSASLQITATNDLLNEFDEDIVVGIDQPLTPFATVDALAASVTTTILDDDPQPTVSIGVTPASIDELGQSATFTVTLSSVSGRDVTIDLAAVGTATGGGVDYVDPPLQITIPAGTPSGSVTVTSVPDAIDEFDETITLQIIAADFASPGTTLQATTSILDDDPEPTVSLTVDNTAIPENAGIATVTVSLSTVSGKDVVVDLQRTGNATPGLDFSGVPLQVTVPAGSPSVSFDVTTIDDDLVELNETISLNMINVQNAVSDGLARTITITDDDIPTLTLTLADSAVNEADGNSATTLTVRRNTNTGGSLLVNLSSNDTGEATLPASVTIPAGQSSVTVPIDAVNDNILDGTQQVTFTAMTPGFVDGTVLLNVEDATTAVNLSVSTSLVGESGPTMVTVTATTDKPAIGNQTLDLFVSGAGITSGDYILSGNTISIADGQSNGSVTFTVTDDAVVESLIEVAAFTMGNLTLGLAAGTTPSANVSIVDNDSATLSIGDVTLTEGDAGDTFFTFTVTLDTDVDTGLSVDYSTADGTATSADNDYTSTGGTINFVGLAGETQPVSVTVTGDQKVELNDFFLLDLSSIQAGGRDVTFADSQGQGTITNDDSATLSIDDISLNEGDAGDTSFLFTVTLDAEVGDAVSLSWDLNQGTATAGTDFTPAITGFLSFAANSGGPQTANIEVLVTGDQTVELDETFFVDLSNLIANGLDVTLADNQGLGTITNDDTAVLSIDDFGSVEGDAGNSFLTFTVTLDNDVDTGFSVDVDTADGTARFGEDYVPNTGSALNFAGTAGETQTFAVTTFGDNKVELDESFLVNLSAIAAGGRNVILGTGVGVGTLINDDSASISIDDVAVTEGDNGTQDMIFTVTLDTEVDTDVSVTYDTSALSASAADGDFIAPTGTLTFVGNAGGPQTATVAVQVTGDTKVELDEYSALISATSSTAVAMSPSEKLRALARSTIMIRRRCRFQT